MIKKYIYSIIGIFIVAIGINLTYTTNLGAAPLEELNRGFAQFFHIENGTMTAITCLILLSASAIITKNKINYKAIIGGLTLGIFINITKPYIILDHDSSFITLLLFTLIGGTLMGIGSAITIENKEIIGYNDAFLVQIKNYFFPRRNIGGLKILYDFTIIAIILFLGLLIKTFEIGIGTFILAFAIGLNIRWDMSIEKFILKEVHTLALIEHDLYKKGNE